MTKIVCSEYRIHNPEIHPTTSITVKFKHGSVPSIGISLMSDSSPGVDILLCEWQSVREAVDRLIKENEEDL